VTEAGVAGLTAMIDIHQLTWREPAIAALALEKIALPVIQRAGADLGPIDQTFAAELGIPRGCRVVLGCLDQYAGAVGAGNVEPGMVSETTGTVLATVRCSDSFEPELERRGVFQGPGYREGLYYEMVFGNVSANVLEAYRRQWSNQPAYELLSDEASRVADGAEGLRFDRLDGDARILFDGRTEQHHRGHEVRAIFEAVAESLNEQVDALCESARPRGLVSVGGAARNDFWLAIKANRLGCPITATACEEPTSLGAAILAASVIGREPVESVARRWVRRRVTIEPRPYERAT
jgi:sugar (pentulose or hexulose) kinase